MKLLYSPNFRMSMCHSYFCPKKSNVKNREWFYQISAVPQIVKETRQEQMMRKNSISFLVDTNAPENGSDDINGENGEIMHMNGVNGTVAHRNGAPEVNRMPPQVRFGYILSAWLKMIDLGGFMLSNVLVVVAGTIFLAYQVLMMILEHYVYS